MTPTPLAFIFVSLFHLLTFSTPLIKGQQVECPPEGIVYLPDVDCTKYWICADGESVPLTCPDGFYFNPDNHECDFPINVPECVGGTRPPITTPTPPTTTTRTTTTSGPPDGILRQCGDRMVGNEGFIEYSLDEMYDPRLRCAFIVRTFNHSGFIFTLEENGLIEDPTHTGGSIQIFGFSSEGLADSANLGPPNPLPQAYVAGSVAVVVFRTQFMGGRGFKLKFEATGAWRHDFANHDDVLNGVTPGSLRYPFEQEEYHYNTLSAFVLSNNYEQIAIGSSLLLNLHHIDIEVCLDGCTCDFLDVYEFKGSGLERLDRFIAVTQPIKYAKHKSNTRVWLTIVFVWVFSGLVGSPIVLGLNTPLGEGDTMDPTSCTFHNYYFTFFSSLCSFYIPCTILVYLYYRIFKVIRERAKKAAGGGGHSSSKPTAVGGTVIENLAQTKRLAETTLGGPSSLPIPPSQPGMEDERGTNTGSGSQDEEEEDMERDLDDGEEEQDEEEPSPADQCQIIANNRLASAFVLESVRSEERGTLERRMEQNGNHDSGYAASNLEEGPHPVAQEPSQSSPKLSLPIPIEPSKRNGLKEVSTIDPKASISGSPCMGVEGASTSSSKQKAPGSRFTICKAHKASRRKKEKSSAKRERKATKTLAIVLGLFLLCWLPFFTCNIMDAICQMLKEECGIGLPTFLLTTWLGYANSCLNPIIYTIFNIEFRKAFKKLIGLGA